MVMERKNFGDYLKELIERRGMSHVEFYTKLDIKKPYFYDILSGRVNPLRPMLQFKALTILKADSQTAKTFFDLAANIRGEMPADIMSITDKNPEFLEDIRKLLHDLQRAKAKDEKST